jgi:hypothetical protein
METKYSRKTIHAHLKDFESSSIYEEEKQKFKILNHLVISKLFSCAMNGDSRASKLFLEVTGAIKSKGIVNNYVQINSLVLTEALLKQMPENRVKEIESVIKLAMGELKAV